MRIAPFDLERYLIDLAANDSECSHLHRPLADTDDNRQRVRIGGPGHVGRRRDCGALRVGMIKPEDLLVTVSRLAPGFDVVVRVEEKARGARFEISATHRLRNPGADAKQHTATFVRCRIARVGEDGVKRPARHFHSDSTTIAIPIPPPMQSEATPKRCCLTRKA